MNDPLSQREWQRLAADLLRQARRLQREATARPGWAGRRGGLLTNINALTGPRGIAAELYDDTIRATLNLARDTITTQLRAEVQAAADDFDAYVGHGVSDPNTAQIVTRRGNAAVLHDWESLEAQTRQAVRSALTQNIGSGAGSTSLAQHLRQITGFARSRVATIARTEYASAQEEMFLENMGRLQVEEWVWKARPDACAICFALHGQVFTADEASGRHQNCRCIMLPVVPTRKGPQPNQPEEISAKYPRRLQADTPTATGVLDRLVVVDNPKWKPTFRLSPPGVTSFRPWAAPTWVPALSHAA
jgi:SPP1 gp7 family putative phage head morphogenesis protein